MTISRTFDKTAATDRLEQPTMPPAPADRLNAGRALLAASGLNQSALDAINTAADTIDKHAK